MDIFQSIILGIVQGLTEFIPVSSSGHLELVPKLLNFGEPTTAYITFLHIGTLIALVIFFRKKIYTLLSSLIKYLKGDRDLETKQNFKLNMFLLISTIPAGIIGLLLENNIENFYDSTSNSELATVFTVVPLIIIGIFFLFTDRLFKNSNNDLSTLNTSKSLTIGVAQAFALIRGVSRSGITLIAGQSLGLSRVSAAEFGFLMSIPIVGATAIFSLAYLISGKIVLNQSDYLIYIFGFLSSFISGIIAIKFLLNFLKNRGLKIFGIYRIIFGILALIILF